MWDFTVDGFTSAVEYNPPTTYYDTKTKQTLDFVDEFTDRLPADYQPATKETLSSHLLVRARVKADLDKLATYDADSIRFEDLSADYQFRIIIRRTAYAQYVYDTAMDINYTSHVKEEMNRRAPQVKGGRMGVFTKIWTAMASLQPNPPYGGYTSTYEWPEYTGKVYGGTSKGKGVSKDGSGQKAISSGTGSPYFDKDGKYIPSYATGSTFGYKDEDMLSTPLTKDEQDELFKDDPNLRAGDEEDWEGLGVKFSATRRSMVDQITDILNDVGEQTDVEAVVDALMDEFGTCDVDIIPFEILWENITKYDINRFVNASSTMKEY
jgi:hypothetical protein